VAGPMGIPIEIEGGTFIVPVTINAKITLNFTIDSVPGKFTLVDEDHQSCAGAFTACKRRSARSCCLGPSYRWPSQGWHAGGMILGALKPPAPPAAFWPPSDRAGRSLR